MLRLIAAIVTQLHEGTKTHQIARFKWVNCMVCELYFNELLFFKKEKKPMMPMIFKHGKT